ncbi:MAG: hypothetical protein JRG76_06775 [Deltaproteobacteria bacterium]|nr:hypothetical protein [Deltaproteobacteria bacterium]MBW2414198.1 hypothetical protein [Deltaproteobacteria bacterium]
MRSNQVFARMSAEESAAFLERLKDEAPAVARLALGAAADAFKLRPTFLKKQPRTRQAEWMRRALGRNIGAAIAEEVLATYFMDHRSELLVELLDTLEVEHEEGTLKDKPDCPEKKKLQAAVEKFRQGEDPETRELLLMAFTAQSSIDWPPLDELLGVEAA